jgi:predicted unusual protein kinase regulating ubiquinone biosynthesis (AarF/ABC1/UbiB family)
MGRLRRYLRALGRMAEVNAVFLGAFLARVGDALGLRRLAAFLTGRPRPEPLTGPLALREALHTLGPTYIKFGQLAASSTGILPERYAIELAKLLDEVPPVPPDEVRRVIEEDLGIRIEEAFSRFDPEPIAAASIAQVHGATLKDGSDVVVKVQRPGIQEIIERDMHQMRMITRTLETLIPVVRLAHPTRQIEDLSTQLHEEIDFTLEASHMERFAQIQKELGNEDVVIPKVHRALTTRRVLTMERLHGIKVSEFDRIRREVEDPAEILIKGVRAWMQSFALYGFFHGDVHAGNFILLPGRRVGYLDFGIMGKFDLASRDRIFRYMRAFVTADVRGLVAPLQEMGSIPHDTPTDDIIHDLEELYAPFFTSAYKDIKYEEIFPAFMRRAARHGWQLPREFTLLTKQMLYFDRYAKALAPEVNLFMDPRVVNFLYEAMSAAG